MERAKLNKLNQWEQSPSKTTWRSICEELDREQVGIRLAEIEEQPSPHPWLQIRKAGINKWIASAKLTLLLIVFLLLLGATYWIVSSDTNPPVLTNKIPTAPPVVSITQQLPQLLPLPVPQPAEENSKAIQQTKPLVKTPAEKTGAVAPELHRSDYLLVASKGGEPIRVAFKWEYLSCCLSGEMQNADCDQQQSNWHAEVLQSELGFQADPLLGLLALIGTEN